MGRVCWGQNWKCSGRGPQGPLPRLQWVLGLRSASFLSRPQGSPGGTGTPPPGQAHLPGRLRAAVPPRKPPVLKQWLSGPLEGFPQHSSKSGAGLPPGTSQGRGRQAEHGRGAVGLAGDSCCPRAPRLQASWSHCLQGAAAGLQASLCAQGSGKPWPQRRALHLLLPLQPVRPGESGQEAGLQMSLQVSVGTGSPQRGESWGSFWEQSPQVGPPRKSLG